MTITTNITPASLPSGDVLIYEYGARIDKESVPFVNEQIRKGRALYNDCVAVIRKAVDDANAATLAHAGDAALAAHAQVLSLNDAFAAAKAADDEPAMKEIAQTRRGHWATLAALLKDSRKSLRKELQATYYSRIGNKSSCETYQLRCRAVADGLGWATANEVLDAALQAFKKSMVRGRAPKFAVGDEKIQDCLTLQFTGAGGVAAADLLAAKNGEIRLVAPAAGAGRRKYGEFQFRLGPAKADTYATGTWQYHRAFPDGARVGIVRLVRRIVGKDTRYALQFQLRLPEAIRPEPRQRLPLATVHFGWANRVDGRRVAGISESAEPTSATIVTLPEAIEVGLNASNNIQARRDALRDEIVPRVKAEVSVPSDAEQEVQDALARLRRTQTQHVSTRNLHRLLSTLRHHAAPVPEWLETWRKEDRLLWQQQAHGARRARNARKGFYRDVALRLAQTYNAIAIEPLNLAEAATKVNERTGEKTDLSKKARSGRVIAALYEFESAIRWAAAKNECAVLELGAETASSCALCGGEVHADEEDGQRLRCDACGAELDRKQNGAALAWQTVQKDLEGYVADYWIARNTKIAESKHAAAEKQLKLQEGRKKARTPSGEE